MNDMVDEFMEQLNLRRVIENFLQSLREKQAHVSPQILIELGKRVHEAKSEEEKKWIIEMFFKDVIAGEIMLYH